MRYHVNDHLAQRLPLFFGEVLEDVAVVFLQQLESHSQVMVLQHGFIVVHQRQLRVCVEVKTVSLVCVFFFCKVTELAVSNDFHLLVLIRNWFDTPGWSTSWMAAAKMAARISRSVKTA